MRTNQYTKQQLQTVTIRAFYKSISKIIIKFYENPKDVINIPNTQAIIVIISIKCHNFCPTMALYAAELS